MKPFLIAALLLTPLPAFAQGYTPSSVSQNNCSGTVVTAATAVTPLAARQAAHGFMLQNLDTTEPLWFSFAGPAVASTPGSFVLQAVTATTYAGSTFFMTQFGFGAGNALSVVAATAGHKFSCSYW
jgi:hypothetical protein